MRINVFKNAIVGNSISILWYLLVSQICVWLLRMFDSSQINHRISNKSVLAVCRGMIDRWFIYLLFVVCSCSCSLFLLLWHSFFCPPSLIQFLLSVVAWCIIHFVLVLALSFARYDVDFSSFLFLFLLSLFLTQFFLWFLLSVVAWSCSLFLSCNVTELHWSHLHNSCFDIFLCSMERC